MPVEKTFYPALHENVAGNTHRSGQLSILPVWAEIQSLVVSLVTKVCDATWEARKSQEPHNGSRRAHCPGCAIATLAQELEMLQMTGCGRSQGAYRS